MHIKKLLTILFTGFAVWGSLQAQDIHFTQYNLAPLALNPSLQGNFSGTVRIGGIYRSQWQSVLGSAKFQTPGLYVDAPIIRGFRRRDWVGVGASFIGDRVGSLPLKRTIFDIGASYHLALNRGATTYLSVGAQYGNDSRKVGDGFTLGDQLETGQASQDPFAGPYANDPNYMTEGSGTNINAGISLTARLNERMNMQVGFAMFHLSQQKYNLIESLGIAKMPRRSLIHGTLNADLTDRWSITPSFFYQTMNNHSEIAVQGLAGYLWDAERDLTFNFGLGYRLGRDIQALLGAQYKDLRVGFAYDINTSDLNQETNYRGGFELAANYIIRIYKQSKIKPKILCPRF
jgi:type IX secretion system PorP/SprF family membrane protein